MENKNYTIKDIARMAGVSAGTVDRVLHNRGDVSAASLEKVRKVLDEINYSPTCLPSGWRQRSVTALSASFLII